MNQPTDNAGRYAVAIVGSGPAGLSAAGRAATLGLSHVLLEQTDHLSDTIFKYQKGKHVMATPASLVLRSDLDFDAGKREAVLGTWERQVADAGVNVRYRAEVVAIEGEVGDFRLKLANGDIVTAGAVVLAIGHPGQSQHDALRLAATCPTSNTSSTIPAEYVDEHIVVIGTGDAGIENALGLAADRRRATWSPSSTAAAEFARAKNPPMSELMTDALPQAASRSATRPRRPKSRPGELLIDTRDGQEADPLRPHHRPHGLQRPAQLRRRAGIAFTSADREAFPALSRLSKHVPGIYVIGALAGYPLIKHCMNQGYDVIEFINGNLALKPADEPILASKLPSCRQRPESTNGWNCSRAKSRFSASSPSLQLRELMLDSEVAAFAPTR